MNIPINHILVIDSSTSILRIGLTIGGNKIAELSNSDRYRHAEFIFKLIEQLLEENNIKKSQLAGVIVSLGPGSFTGLRVGMSSAKGIAVSLGIPIAGISIYTAMADPVFSIYHKALLLIPSRRDEFYTGLIESAEFDISKIKTASTSEITSLAGDLPILGVDIENLKYDKSALPNMAPFQATLKDYIEVGTKKLENGGDDLDQLEPLYIQNFQVKKKKQK